MTKTMRISRLGQYVKVKFDDGSNLCRDPLTGRPEGSEIPPREAPSGCGRAARSLKNRFIFPEKPPIDDVGECVTRGESGAGVAPVEGHGQDGHATGRGTGVAPVREDGRASDGTLL